MKTTKLWAAMVAATFLALADANAQTWNVPGETGASNSYLGTSAGNLPISAGSTTSNGNITFATYNGSTGVTPLTIFNTGNISASSGTNSFSSGSYSTTTGFAFGNGNTLTAPYSATFGQGNTIINSSGQGSNNSFIGGASNSITGSYDAVIFGDGNTISPNSSGSGSNGACAIGYYNSVSAAYAGALGFQNSVAGVYSGAWGLINTIASGANGSYAFGNTNTVSTSNSFAIGQYLKASGTNSIVLGSGSSSSSLLTNSTNNSLAIGFGGTSPAFTVAGYGSGSNSSFAGKLGVGTAPSSYQLAVTGTTNLNGNVTIPGTNTLSVGGTSTLSGGATIGSTSTTSYLNGIFNCTNATFNGGIFNNTTTMSSLVLGGASISSPSPNYTSPTGLNSSAYNFTMGGNANIKGALVIGDDPSYFNSSTSSAIAAFPTSNNSNSNYSLFVAGGIITEAATVAVANTGYWADFVFDKGYKLTPLKELESFITKNHHLPEIPSAEEVVKSGVNVAQMDAKLLQKIEELTLYVIEIKKENETLKERMSLLENKQ